MRLVTLMRAMTVALGVTVASVAFPLAARAQVVVPCSETALKADIAAANTAGGGTLVLTPGCTYPITTPDVTKPSDGLPPITTPITIVGNGDTITRTSAVPFRLFEIDAPHGNLTVTGLTVSNGWARSSKFSPDSNRGGGFWLHGGGALTLSNSTVTGNTADSYGGGVADEGGTVTVNNSTLRNNTAFEGGGIDMDTGATATFNNSTVTGNTSSVAGGIYTFDNSRLTLNSTQITANTANAPYTGGGGIASFDGTTTLNSSIISGNTATGPTDAGGGGIYNGVGSTLNVNSTQINANAANGSHAAGGGISNYGTATLRSSPVTGNSATGTTTAQGGGIYNTGTTTLQSSPVASNTPDNCGTPSTVPGCS